MNRYFFSRRKDGTYHIIDRHIDLRIAKAEFREAAVQIIGALNEQEHTNKTMIKLPPIHVSELLTGKVK